MAAGGLILFNSLVLILPKAALIKGGNVRNFLIGIGVFIILLIATALYAESMGEGIKKGVDARHIAVEDAAGF